MQINISSTSEILTTQEALSGIFGSISLATWIFLLVPQLVLNYRTSSADGISLGFLAVWLIGDITNLSGNSPHAKLFAKNINWKVIGAVWASLVPTVIVLACYYIATSLILISQTIYYQRFRPKGSKLSASAFPDSAAEEAPLLAQTPITDPISLVGHQKYNSFWAALYNSLAILSVTAAGIIGWAIAYYLEIWVPTPLPEETLSFTETSSAPIGAEILGYISSIFYLSARLPQIIKNYRNKSCDGLALLFFLLSLYGNATYGLSILSHSLEKNYIIINLPWLIGSLGTMFEDSIIFYQFHIYSKSKPTISISGPAP
ncbi:vacuolar membrane PQ loop repeat protein [Blumeria hordei DH14]|uniref:Vacuolar membrane PQ loop repeat protein n=1 Tax=Blumeria graminis f. sp. hordei (strain DH14) TaxID=546991 RepID=N1JFI9_BLUG1|nr:vacuolar membrane PQ loop repeat protein [Blumeria hordei DH14]